MNYQAKAAEYRQRAAKLPETDAGQEAKAFLERTAETLEQLAKARPSNRVQTESRKPS